MTREEVEKEAREVADKFRDLAKKATLYYISVSDIQVPHRESIGFERGFIAGAVAAAEPCERELEALRARVAELEGLVPRWVSTKRAFELGPQGWTDAAHYGSDLRLMVPPIPLPEPKP